MKKIRGDIAVWLLLTAAAALMLLPGSMNSWLYPVNPWVDVNIISTVGRGMFDGLVPYRDLVEQKGPLLLFVFGLAEQIAPGSYHGLYIFEALALGCAMFFGWKTLQLYLPGLSPAWMAPLYAVMIIGDAFQTGGSAEELLLALVTWSLYDILKAWRSGAAVSTGALARNGFFAGCVLWVKFNLLAFHFVWMAALAIDALWRGRKFIPPLKTCLIFLGGMALASVPWIGYFAANGALGNLVGDYFVANLTGYGVGGDSALMTILQAIMLLLRRAPVYLGLLALAGGAALLAPRRVISLREKLLLTAMAALMCAAMYSRSATNIYYGVMLAVFLPFALLPLKLLRFRMSGWLRAVGGALCIAVCTILVFWAGDYTRYIGTAYAETPQGWLASRMEEEAEDATLLQHRCMDFGFYFSADMRPAHRWFTFLNIRQDEYMEQQAQFLAEGGCSHVIVAASAASETVALEKYEIIDEYVSNYGSDDPEFFSRYTLYRLVNEE